MFNLKNEHLLSKLLVFLTSGFLLSGSTILGKGSKVRPVTGLTVGVHKKTYVNRGVQRNQVPYKKIGVAESAVRKAARYHSVPEDWLLSICKVESGLNTTAYNYNDGGRRTDHAFGICQVLYSTAKGFGRTDQGCERDFRKFRRKVNSGLQRTHANCMLFNPDENARVAARVLKFQMNRYGKLEHAIAAYNSGSVKFCAKGGLVRGKRGQILYTCAPGGLLNQKYVDLVKIQYRKIQREKKAQAIKEGSHQLVRSADI